MSTGRNASIGPVLSIPSSDAPQPFWKIAVTTPNAAPTESRFITAAVSGISEAAEHRHQQQEAEQHDDADEQRQLADRTWLKSSKIAVLPADQHVQAGPALGGGHDLVADVVQQVRGRDVLRRALRVDVRRSRRPAGR